MAKFNGSSKFNRAEVTAPTESEYEGIPMLAIPGNHPKFPIQMTLPKWRKVLAYLAQIEAFTAKHKDWQPAPKQSKPAATAGDGQVDLSKLDPAIRALVEAAIKGSTPVPTPAPAPAPAPVKEMTVEERIAALRAKMAAK